MAGAAEIGKVGLQRAHLRSDDERASDELAIDRAVDLAAEPTPLRGHVDERDRRGIGTGVLVHVVTRSGGSAGSRINRSRLGRWRPDAAFAVALPSRQRIATSRL